MGRKVIHHKIICVTQSAESREELSTNSDSKRNGKVLKQNVSRVLKRLSTCVIKVDGDSSVKRITQGSVTRDPLHVQLN